MPTYQYVCEACNDEFEVVQSFTDATLTEHDPGCGGHVRKRFNAVGVVFKGSGFYRNDSRGKESSSDAGSSSSGSESSAAASSSDTSSAPAKTESKPSTSAPSTTPAAAAPAAAPAKTSAA